MDQICPNCASSYDPDQTGGLCPRCLAQMAVHSSDPPEPAEPVLPLQLGQTFYDYKILALIAQGGMGVVYRARKAGESRDVALKILPPSLAAEREFRLRFDREARALAGLAHPNIVRLLDYGVEEKLMFLVMEFVEGVSLRESLRSGGVTPARAVAIALDLCRALEFAHHERVIHRDVKPENILIDKAGRIKLTDFGLAKRIDADSTRVTQTNYAVGTPHYMAPEQLEQPDALDHRVDIYSLGVVLYEMIARELPIGRFPLPSKRAGVDPAFDDIVCRCLEKDPDQRYANIVELQAALAALPIAPVANGVKPAPRPKVSSNLEIRCPCGWQFYIPAGARGRVHCPSCGEPVRLDVAASPPPALTPTPMPAARPASPSRSVVIKLAAAVGLLAALGVVLLVLVMTPGPARRATIVQDIAWKAPEAPPQPAPPPPAPPAPAPTKLPLPAAPLLTPVELRLRLGSLIAEANMSGIIATILLNSGRPSDHDVLQDRVRAIDGDIHDTLILLEEQGHVQDVPDRFQSGDRLISFAGKRIDPARSIAFADDLRAWLRAFRPGVSGSIIVQRRKQTVVFDFVFAERSPELVVLAHQAGVVLGATPDYVPPPTEPKPTPAAPIPASVLEPLRARMNALPKPYRDLIPYEDRGRAEALLLAGQAAGEDLVFLQGRYADLLRKCEDEQRSIPIRIKELEAKIADPTLQTDTVLCKDGRRLEGSILEETETQIKLKVRLGSIIIRREEISRIEKGKGAGQEFRAAYDAAKGRKSELQRLAAFAKEKKLPAHQELAALCVVVLDPADERSRADSGLPRTPFASGSESEPVMNADRIEYRGRTYTPDQFRSELKALGYVQVNGVWCEKISRSVKIDNLYRDDSKLNATYRGASIQAQTHTERDTIYDYQTKSFVPRTKQVSVARYIGGGGSCFIEITAPGDIVEAHVHARSQVVRIGGAVTVSAVLSPEDGVPKVLYSLAAPGENNGTYDATEKVAGHNRFYVRADVHGDGMFLVSDSNDLGVFEVKYSYGRPLERINALFAAAALVVPESPSTPPLKPGDDSVEAGCRNVASSAAQNATLVDSLTEVRKLTETLTYSREYGMPARFYDVAVQLKDPLSPDWNGLTRDQAIRLGTWWGLLPLDDRREFLTAYGMWCARSRYQRGIR